MVGGRCGPIGVVGECILCLSFLPATKSILDLDLIF